MTMENKQKRLWSVKYNKGKSLNGLNHYGSEYKKVIAETAEEAMAKIKAEDPEVIFVAIVHEGVVYE